MEKQRCNLGCQFISHLRSFRQADGIWQLPVYSMTPNSSNSNFGSFLASDEQKSFGTPGHVDGSVGFPTTLFSRPSNNTWQHLSITIWGSAHNSPHPPFLCAVAKTGSVANSSPAPRLAVPASWLTTPAPEAWLQSPAGGTFLEELFGSK